MYYVLKADARLAKKYIYFDKQPDTTETDDWTTGRPFDRAWENCVMTTSDSEAGEFSDMVLNRPRLLIVSPKLRGVLQDLGVTNVEYLPIKLVDEARGVTRDDYQLMNVLGRIACLDVEHSTVVMSRRGNHFTTVENFNLLEDLVHPLPGSDAAPLLFRLDEFEDLALAHARVKDAFEKAGITGAGFTTTQKYF